MRDTRLPLQVGTSAFWSLLRSAALFLPSSIAFFGVVIPSVVIFFEMPDILGDFIGKAFVGLVVLLAAGPFVLLKSALKHARNAWEERPSDLVLGEGSQVMVLDGPSGGRSLDGSQCALQTYKHRNVEVAELTIQQIVVARAARSVERESLRTLHDTLIARGGAEHVTKPAAAAGPSLLVCPKCDAPAIPDDADTVTCKFCSASVPVPKPLRDKIHAQRTLAADRPRNARMIGRLLRQPSARVVWIVMLALGAPMLAVWPACAYALVRMHRHGVLSFVGVATLVFASMLALAALFVLMRVTLVNRQALALVSSRFSALPPDKPGAPRLCRVCQAPLPDAGAQTLIKCAYCDADNITGLDLRIQAGAAAAQHRSIDDELARRRHERRLWGLAGLGAVLVVVSLRWILPFAFQPHTDDGRCNTGDAAACVREAKRIESGKVYNDDIREVLDRYHRACAAHDDQACRDAARVAYSWAGTVFEGYVDTVPDLRKGCDLGDGSACEVAAIRMDHGAHPDDYFAITKRACELGNAAGCSDHGFAYESGFGTAKDLRQALGWYSKGCAGGNLLGCANAGFAAENATPPDFATAASFFDRSCPRDAKDRDDDVCGKAAGFFKRRCDAGDQAACSRTKP